ncbi:MAG TPA: glycoside hydrolase family 36 protein, partial [Anaerolineales bacterium]
PGSEGYIRLRYWLEEFPEENNFDSFGLKFGRVENLRAYLRQGYNSWDGSFYVEPEMIATSGDTEAHLETGYAMTQLLPRSGSGCVVVGFDRHDRFQQTFTFDMRGDHTALTVLTYWDQKDRNGLARCASEDLVIFDHPDVEAALREWAHLVAAASPLPACVTSSPINGWCSWYNLYSSINEDNILEHLRGMENVVKRENLPMRVFQIDDGFTPEMGDWLEVKPQFPRGMKPILDEIRTAGFIPGLWIAPFMVGNRSRLYRHHPDWVVRERHSGDPLVQMKFYGEFRWHKRSEEYYILDTTHPGAFEYLREVFRTWRWEWGCGYFKTDFMNFGSQYGPDRAQWHRPGLTRIEIWRRMAEMIRAEIGEDALWLGCGCPLWASVGLVEAVRIGRDVGVIWQGDLSAQSLLRDLPARNFANHVLWQIDPDCILLRDQYHYLTEGEVRSLALFAGMSGGVMMTSDALDQLSEERLHLWSLLLNAERKRCDFPFLGQVEIDYQGTPPKLAPHQISSVSESREPVLVQVRRSSTPDSSGAILFSNPTDIQLQRNYRITELGLEQPVYIYDWLAGIQWDGPVEKISIALPPHDSRLLFFDQKPIMSRPEFLP